MWNEFCGPAEMTEIRVVQSCGMAVALPEDAVIGVLALADDPAHAIERIDGIATLYMDDRQRPLVSLKQALCVETAAGHARTEDVVVVLRMGRQLFGLLVETARAPELAMVLPTVTPQPTLAVFNQLLQMNDGGILFQLNPIWLALSIERPAARRGVEPTIPLAA
jgi:two-component system, chemotaxis family, sensor kinase CheA